MKVLVIYELNPEETNFYTLQDPPKEDLKILIKSHGSYGNMICKNEEAAIKVGEMLENVKHDKLEPGKPFDASFDMIIHTGFIL